MADEIRWVTLKLSNPLSTAQSEQLRARDARDYRPGEEITVPYDVARNVIGSGYAAVDPEDHQAVREALNDASGTAATAAAPTNGGTTDTAASTSTASSGTASTAKPASGK